MRVIDPANVGTNRNLHTAFRALDQVICATTAIPTRPGQVYPSKFGPMLRL